MPKGYSDSPKNPLLTDPKERREYWSQTTEVIHQMIEERLGLETSIVLARSHESQTLSGSCHGLLGDQIYLAVDFLSDCIKTVPEGKERTEFIQGICTYLLSLTSGQSHHNQGPSSANC
jgi:hypothetical protein